MKQYCMIVTVLLLAAGRMFSQPVLQKNGSATQLMVSGRPYLVLGAELHNSSSSNAAYLASLWQPLKDMHLNTVLAAVSWEVVEPRENAWDFSLVDTLLAGARAHDLKLVLLWFGSWKNGLSHYAPLWVKQDTRRFPRIVLQNGRSTETITALSAEAARSDARAFAALMAHLKQVDAPKQTVIMVQVENEVGVIGSTRDHSPAANALFAQPVPAELMKGLQAHKAELQPALQQHWQQAGAKASGSWTDVFGANAFTDEAFMAWQYARYVNGVAAAGKAAYNIPLFVNTWIVQPQDKQPGDYPAGGPQSHLHDIWRIGAPAIDIRAPDIYLPAFKEITALYQHSWNPLFVPESFSGEAGAANAFYAIGQYNGIGYSPFGIDAPDAVPGNRILAKAYDILSQLAPEILAAQSGNTIRAFSLSQADSVNTFELGGYRIKASLRHNWGGLLQANEGYGLIIQSGKDAFTVAGCNIDLVFQPLGAGPRMAGLASVYEGEYRSGRWTPGRLLNGDDIMMSYNLAAEAAAGRTGTGIRIKTTPGIMKVKLYRFE